jgi:hypothetical protein
VRPRRTSSGPPARTVTMAEPLRRVVGGPLLPTALNCNAKSQVCYLRWTIAGRKSMRSFSNDLASSMILIASWTAASRPVAACRQVI